MKGVYTRLINVAVAVFGDRLLGKENARAEMLAMACAKHLLEAGVE